MKKKRATKAETRELLHCLTVLANDVLDQIIKASCIVRVESDARMVLGNLLNARDRAKYIADKAHLFANEIDPEPAFPNPHKHRQPSPRAKKGE